MPTFQESVNGALRGGLCAVLGANETAAKVLTSVSGDPLGVVPLASGLRRQLCSDDPDNDPTYEPPFNGGQCPGVTYIVTLRTRNVDSPTPQWRNPVQLAVTGPIAIKPISESGFNCNDPARPFEGNAGIYNGAGDLVANLAGGCFDVPNGYEILSIDRADGQPDNCGDPPPPPVDPEPVPGPPTDITYNIDGDTNITVPLTAVYAPIFVDLDGSIKAPVTVNVGGIDFNGTIKISPEFEVEISPTINIGGPGSPDDPDVIGEPGGGAEPIDDVEDLESTIVGVLVYSDITAEAGSGSVAFTNGPDLYIPRLASVQFAIKTRNSIGWTSDLDVKNLECYVPCPAPQGAIAVRVSPMPGVSSRFTAVRAQPLTSF